jgi:hypothetical protein
VARKQICSHYDKLLSSVALSPRSRILFEPEILGVSSSVLWSLTQAMITPALGFAFLYLVGVPLAELPFLPKGTKYEPPNWVLPVFAHGSAFILVSMLSTGLLLHRLQQHELADEVKAELYLVRELDTAAKLLTKVSIRLERYDGLSDFRIFANGYHVFSSDRDCVTSFQCTSNAPEADKGLKDLKEHRVGGSLYELNVTNSLPHEISLNHYLALGQNYIDFISENSGTGGCDFSAAILVEQQNNEKQYSQKQYSIDIRPNRDPHGGSEPERKSLLMPQETFHSGGPQSGDAIARYNTSAIERRNLVCERIRISLNLTKDQAGHLSSERGFASYFLSRQKAYICETIGKVIPGCGT